MRSAIFGTIMATLIGLSGCNTKNELNKDALYNHNEIALKEIVQELDGSFNMWGNQTKTVDYPCDIDVDGTAYTNMQLQYDVSKDGEGMLNLLLTNDNAALKLYNTNLHNDIREINANRELVKATPILERAKLIQYCGCDKQIVEGSSEFSPAQITKGMNDAYVKALTLYQHNN